MDASFFVPFDEEVSSNAFQDTDGHVSANLERGAR